MSAIELSRPVFLAPEVAQVDPDRYLAALFAPAPARDDLIALYAFNYEVARIRETVTEPMIGAIRLQWWRDAVSEILAGGPVRAHPVTAALAVVHARRGLPREPVDALLDARERDVHADRPLTWGEADDYVDATSGGLIALAARSLGEGAEADGGAVRAAGRAWAYCGFWRVLLAGGRIPIGLPAEALVEAGLAPDGSGYAPGSPPAERLMAMAAERARRALVAVRESRFDESHLPAILHLALARPTLDGGRELGDIGKRARLIWASLRGRVV